MKLFTYLVLFLCLCLAGVAHADDDYGWAPFEIVNGQMIVDATIAGHETKAVLSAGATIDGISWDFLDEYGHELRRALHGQDVRYVSAGQEYKVVPYIEVPISVLGVPTTMPYLVPGDFEGAGLMLGEQFFDRGIVQVDYPNGRLRKLKRRALKLKKLANVKARRTDAWGGGLSIKVNLNGEVDRWLAMSTSSRDGIVISRGLADKYGWLEKYPIERRQVVDYAGQLHDVLSFNIDTFTIGPYTLENVIVNVPDTHEWRGLNTGSIDLEVLQHFVLTMDVNKRRLHIAAPVD